MDNETPPVVEPVPPESPKLSCDLTLVVRDGELKSLKVRSLEELTYSQLKEICTAGAQKVDMEFTNRCKKLNAMVYEPAVE